MQLLRSFGTTNLWLISFLFAATQAAANSIDGTVYDDAGGAFPQAPIQLINAATGQVSRTRSNDAGRYGFEGLAAGHYQLSVSMPCCALASFSEEDLEVVADHQLVFDVHLLQGDSLHTFGDDPATIADFVRRRQEIPDSPVPTMAYGKPNLSGVWLVGHDPFPVKPKPLEWAVKVVEERTANFMRDHPHNRCLPGGFPIPAGGSPFIGKLVQTDELLLILFEDVPGFRQVFLDGREHPHDPNPSWMGHSIGRWEGATLVVDTVGFNDRLWLGPLPVSEKLHAVERYTRTQYGVIELQVTYEDPEVLAEPLIENTVLDLAPSEELIEYVCENNKWAPKGES